MREMQLGELTRMYDKPLKVKCCTIKPPFTAIVPRVLMISNRCLILILYCMHASVSPTHTFGACPLLFRKSRLNGSAYLSRRSPVNMVVVWPA